MQGTAEKAGDMNNFHDMIYKKVNGITSDDEREAKLKRAKELGLEPPSSKKRKEAIPEKRAIPEKKIPVRIREGKETDEKRKSTELRGRSSETAKAHRG
eukprot:TRINITY_DN6401_c0_g1_i1.p1 TRINITY_DN6401_c0_g1~~TRINITY_DN6401_c0_g1_i1.p1  ORF type:complete len:99 (+),score=48.10 TRINITY_DN6401_c0_g1_i1:216-512(+)